MKADLTTANNAIAEKLEKENQYLFEYYVGKRSPYDHIERFYEYCKGVVQVFVLDDGGAMVIHMNTGKQIVYDNRDEAFSDAIYAAQRASKIERALY